MSTAVESAKNDAQTVANFLSKEVQQRFGIPDRISLDKVVHFEKKNEFLEPRCPELLKIILAI